MSHRAPRRATFALMLRHPAHWIALGFGSGLAPKAPGTFGTLWAWIVYALVEHVAGPLPWGWIVVGGTLVGWWACTATARALHTPDPGAVVWDEVVAFWLVLWLGAPHAYGLDGWAWQALAFGLFRLFDAAKPGPVGWADRLFKAERGAPIGWAQGFGILFDDFVAAACALAALAVARLAWLAA
ncbi:MAG: phosphatidylglycerophosphatase A [Pelomonas sp.]|nr:phosphatidylglycerophosphatase A [Roseateles sp.]